MTESISLTVISSVQFTIVVVFGVQLVESNWKMTSDLFFPERVQPFYSPEENTFRAQGVLHQQGVSHGSPPKRLNENGREQTLNESLEDV